MYNRKRINTMPSPIPSSFSTSSSSSSKSSSSSSVKVAVRLRPMNAREDSKRALPVVHASSLENTITAVRGYGKSQQRSTFSFDHVFSSYTTQEEVFESTLKPVIKDVLNGFESTVFAYGQTGTGKTYTMEGDLSNTGNYGVIPRSADCIFNQIKKPEYISHSVIVSYLEIYNEELRDLLLDDNGQQQQSPSKINKLEIMEGRNGIVCRNLTEKEVKSAADVLTVMKMALKHRKVGETKMNQKSSRSHCVFTIRLSAQRKLRDGRVFDTRGKLHLVDLAGSECAKSSALDKINEAKDSKSKMDADEAYRDRGRERSNINRSLLTLGRVIIMLKKQSSSKKQSSIRIPYRDSKLTRILQDSLGGPCKTLIIATLSPSELAIEETMSTLNYAQSASGIINKPVAVSYMKLPESRCSTPSKDFIENKGVEHWYEMETRMEYLQSQLDEAQAALARHYDGQKEIRDRAEKAENELHQTKGKLKTAEEHLLKSLTILRRTKKIIDVQQKEIASAKIEQKRLVKLVVPKVLSGVTDLVNEQVSHISNKRDEDFDLIENQNCALDNNIDEVRSSANKILRKISTTNSSIHRQTNKSRMNHKQMTINTTLTNKALSDLNEAWDRQRKMVDSFVTQTNDKVKALTKHEENILSISSALQKDYTDTKTAISETLQDALNDGISDLSDVVNTHTNHTKDEVLGPTIRNLEEMENNHTKVMSDVSRAMDNTSVSVQNGKENIAKVTNKQCNDADELRDEVELVYNGFGHVAAKTRRSAINERMRLAINISNDFNRISADILTSTQSRNDMIKADAREFANDVVGPWGRTPPIIERKKIEYKRSLSYTPAEEELLKDKTFCIND